MYVIHLVYLQYNRAIYPKHLGLTTIYLAQCSDAGVFGILFLMVVLLLDRKNAERYNTKKTIEIPSPYLSGILRTDVDDRMGNG